MRSIRSVTKYLLSIYNVSGHVLAARDCNGELARQGLSFTKLAAS